MAGVVLFCPCPIDVKLNGEVTLPPIDVEGFTRVNTNGGSLILAISFVVVFVVPGVLNKCQSQSQEWIVTNSVLDSPDSQNN